MKSNKKSNKILKSVFVIVSLLAIVIGTSYAIYTKQILGSLTSTITSSGLELEFLESQENVINITNAIPMSDEEGIEQEETFDFAVTSKTTNDIALGYTLTIEKLAKDTGYTLLNDSDIKIYLEDYEGNELLSPTLVSDLTNYKFYSNVHTHNASTETIQDKFKLRVWIDESKTAAAQSWDENTKLQYKFKIGLNALETDPYTVSVAVNNGTVVGNTSKSVVPGSNAQFKVNPTDPSAEGTVTCTNSQTGTITNNILTVSNITRSTTCTVTFTPSTTVLYTDGTFIINEKPADRAANITEHGAVTNEYAAMSNSNAYVFTTANEQLWRGRRTRITTVEIGQQISPISTSHWAYGLTQMTTGDFTNLDTSNVTDMSYMFYNAGTNLTTFTLIGLNNWDVSNVITMQSMFYNTGLAATTWDLGDLSSWDTSSVEIMTGMFANSGYKVPIFRVEGIENWNTSNVTKMNDMFSQAGAQSTEIDLDLSNWDTSSVDNMQNMFFGIGRYSASTVTIGNLTLWDTSKVTNMQQMFSNAGYNATTWNSIGTLKVYATNIYRMFYECKNIKAILNIYSNPASGTTGYDRAFRSAATVSGSLITVNYSSATTNIDSIIATKSSDSNVVKGSQLD